jgi:hypothetical protein
MRLAPFVLILMGGLIGFVVCVARLTPNAGMLFVVFRRIQTWPIARLMTFSSTAFSLACLGEGFLTWSAGGRTPRNRWRLLSATSFRVLCQLFSFGLAEMSGFVSFYFAVLVWTSFYASICIREKAMKFLALAKYPSAKRHQRLLFGQLMILLVVIYGMMIAYRTLDVVGLEQVLGGLMTSALGIVLDIVAHLFFLLSPDELGNSEGSYRVLFIADAVVQVLELSISLFFMGCLLIKSQLPIFYLRQIYEHSVGAYNYYGNWRTWMKMRLMIERLPITDEADIRREDICIICRLDMNVGAGRRLPCGHCFHSECIERWVGRQWRCPICKHDLKTPFESSERNGHSETRQWEGADEGQARFHFRDLVKRESQ